MKLTKAEIKQIVEEVEQNAKKAKRTAEEIERAKIEYQWKLLMQEIVMESRHSDWGDRD